MFRLPLALAAWPSADFAAVLKREIEQLPPEALPLQEGLSSSSYAVGDRFSVMPIGVTRDDGGALRARVGIFYQGITAGCNCADDPTPVEPQHEYCEIEISIDKASGEAVANLV